MARNNYEERRTALLDKMSKQAGELPQTSFERTLLESAINTIRRMPAPEIDELPEVGVESALLIENLCNAVSNDTLEGEIGTSPRGKKRAEKDLHEAKRQLLERIKHLEALEGGRTILQRGGMAE